jgi:hypothetical protein
MENDFIDRGADALLAILLADLYFQQKTLFGNIITFQNISQLLLCVIGVEVCQKTQIATVDANDFNIVARQCARGAKHITVTADDYREIRLLTNFCQRTGARF